MGEDEEGTLAALKAIWRNCPTPRSRRSRRIVKNTGDGVLVEFAAWSTRALRGRCAARDGRAQRQCPGRAAHRVPHGINISRHHHRWQRHLRRRRQCRGRLEALAEPGGICVSRVVRDQVRDKLDFAFEDRGDSRSRTSPVGRAFDVDRHRECDNDRICRPQHAPLRRSVDRGAALFRT